MEGKQSLRVIVLGNLAVLRDGARLQLPPSRKTRALLAYLAVTARRHGRDRLCAMFWNIPDDPRAALRWSLSHLRPLVDEPDCRRILADREQVRFDLGRGTVDILSLRAACQHGVGVLSIDALRQATEALESDFLEGLDLPNCHEFQSWCTGQRDETRRLRARLLRELVTRLESAPGDALPHARTLSLVEPADEAVQAMLLRLLRATGRRHEAEEHFRTAERRLAELNAVRTGALRQAAQVPLHTDAPRRDDDATAPPRDVHRPGSRPLHEVRINIRIAFTSVEERAVCKAPFDVPASASKKPVLILVHGENSNTGHVGRWFVRNGYQLDIRRPRFGDPLPETLTDHCGAVICGDPKLCMSSNNKDEFIRRETDWIGVALREKMPFLGICIGAQMLTQHLGGRVRFDPKEKEVGYFPLLTTEQAGSIGPFPDHVYQWHRWGCELPRGIRLLATSRGAFPNQAFAYGPTAVGVQFHPQVTYQQVAGAREQKEEIEDHVMHARGVQAWLDRFLDRWVRADLSLG
jgi:GMP synthase (glutamine-hydrolysing)